MDRLVVMAVMVEMVVAAAVGVADMPLVLHINTRIAATVEMEDKVVQEAKVETPHESW